MSDNMNTENVTAPKTTSNSILVYVESVIHLGEGDVKVSGGIRVERYLVDKYLEKVAKSAILKALTE